MGEQIAVEVLVIGSGVIGSSIAYHLARQGRRVLVVERGHEEAIEPVASWASAGGVRRQGRHPAEALLASEAIARWPTLGDELEADLRFRRGGQLLLAETEDEARQLEEFVSQQRAMGFRDVRLVERQEALELAPGLNQRVLAGSYSPADGQADPGLTTRAFAAAARRHGALYWHSTEVTALLMQEGCVIGASTSLGSVRAEQVVLAAGAWSDELAATIGLPLPITMHALQMLLSSPAPSVTLRPVISALGCPLSLKQLDDGAFLIGGGWPGNILPDRSGYALRPESIEGNWQTACKLLPVVDQQRHVRSWCGLEAISVDGIPFIGSVAGYDGLILALGFSGHGFALSPAVGRCVADLIAGQPVPELAGLSFARVPQ